MVTLLADFGGNIGLWIGFSCITFVEWIELLLELCYYCYYKYRRNRRQRKRAIETHFSNKIANAQARFSKL